jgi:hypothetical protein
MTCCTVKNVEDRLLPCSFYPLLLFTDATDAGTYHPVSFGVIVSSKSHRVQGLVMPARSILGLFARQGTRCCGHGILDDESFVKQIFGKQGYFRNPVYSLCIDRTGGTAELILGGLHEGIKGWVPLVSAIEYPMLEDCPHCMIRIRRASVVAHDGTSLLNFPFVLARFDTGNTWLSLPRSAYQRYSCITRDQGFAGLRLELDNSLVLFLPAFLFSASVAEAQATGFGALAEDTTLEDTLMVIGNSAMKVGPLAPP